MVIKESQIDLSIEKRCHVLGVNRSSYYKWLNAKTQKIDDFAEAEVLRIYHKHKGTYGRMRITQEMRNTGTRINHKKVYRIMRKLGLRAVIRKKWSYRKYIKQNVAANILNREFKADKPLQKLVCDVTELKRIHDKRYYLFSIMDLYSNAIIATNVSFHNDWGLVAKALEALPEQVKGSVLHSDQGSQFTSILYCKSMQEKKVILSMSRVGNCYDNAAKESFFGHFKEEFYTYYNPKTQEELYRDILEFIHYYNTERIQMRFKMSPLQYLKSQNFTLPLKEEDSSSELSSSTPEAFSSLST